MKKKMMLAVLLGSLCLVAGCSSKPKETEAPAPAATEAPKVEETQAPETEAPAAAEVATEAKAEVEEQVSEVVEAGAEMLSEAQAVAEEAASEAEEAVEGLSEAQAVVEEAVSEAEETAVEMLSEAQAVVEEQVSEAQDAAVEMLSEAQAVVEEAVSEAEETFAGVPAALMEEAVSEAEEAVEGLTEAQAVVEEAVSEAEEALEALTEAQNAYEEITEADSEEASELVGELAEEITEEELAGRPKYNALDYVSLGQYTGLPVTVDEIVVTDEEVERAIASAAAAADVYDVLTEGTVEEGDIANIDYEGKKDGIAFDGGTAEGYDLTIGSHAFIDGFEDGLIGAVIGETVDLNLTFPENYGAQELAGQDVVFTVKVNSVKRAPEITETLVSQISSGAYTTLDGYREYIRGQLTSDKEAVRANAVTTELMTQLYNTCPITEYPQDLVDYSVDQMKEYYTEMASYYGMELPEFLNLYFGMDEETFNGEASEAVKETLQQELILVAIADQENIEVTDDEYEAGCIKYMGQMGYTSVDEFKADYLEDQIRLSLRMEEAMSLVRDSAVVTVASAVEEVEAVSEAAADVIEEAQELVSEAQEAAAELVSEAQAVVEATTEA